MPKLRQLFDAIQHTPTIDAKFVRLVNMPDWELGDFWQVKEQNDLEKYNKKVGLFAIGE